MVPDLRQRQSQRLGPGVEAALLWLAGAIGPGQVAAMGPQGVGNMLWALPQLALRPEQLTGLQAPSMKPQALSNSALGLAKLGVHDDRVFAALFDAAAAGGVKSPRPVQPVLGSGGGGPGPACQGGRGLVPPPGPPACWSGVGAESKRQLH